MSTHVSIHAPRLPTAAPAARPRELGIYVLPDGRDFVVSTLYSGGCSLYPALSWNRYGGAEYGVDPYGRLCRRGEPTRWKLSDLVDTGRTGQYPSPVIR